MTQETEDVVGRLRLFGSARPQLGLPVCDEAADLLERLSDRIDVLEGLIRECRLADAYAARTGDEGRWDRAFHELCRAETHAALHQEGIEP